MKYRRKETVTAVRWWKHGDHPAVSLLTKTSGMLLGRELVMPGYWIVDFGKSRYGRRTNKAFRAEFEPIEETNDDHA